MPLITTCVLKAKKSRFHDRAIQVVTTVQIDAKSGRGGMRSNRSCPLGNRRVRAVGGETSLDSGDDSSSFLYSKCDERSVNSCVLCDKAPPYSVSFYSDRLLALNQLLNCRSHIHNLTIVACHFARFGRTIGSEKRTYGCTDVRL
jgi:hypothetical protein